VYSTAHFFITDFQYKTHYRYLSDTHQVQPVKSGTTWKRLDFQLKDENQTIPVKFWNAQADCPLKVGDEATMRNVQVLLLLIS